MKGSALKKSVLPSEQDRPDVARRRARWKAYQDQIDPKRLVFIDETWVKTNMIRTHGRCKKGERLHAKAPYGHWKTMTFIGALRHDRIDAPCVLDRAVKKESFLAYIKQFLIPTLKSGDIVVMDNLPVHKSKEVRAALRAVGVKLFLLPKYSPDLNPIEQLFSKIKALMRKAAERTVDDVCQRLGQLLDTVSPQECANFFRNSGYAAT